MPIASILQVNLPLKRREAKDQLRELCSDFVKVRCSAYGFCIRHVCVHHAGSMPDWARPPIGHRRGVVVRFARQEVQDKLAGELRAGVTACNEEITAFIKPLEAATAAEVARVEKAEADRSALLERLGDLKMQAANVE
jgi:hypothetical protein